MNPPTHRLQLGLTHGDVEAKSVYYNIRDAATVVVETIVFFNNGSFSYFLAAEVRKIEFQNKRTNEQKTRVHARRVTRDLTRIMFERGDFSVRRTIVVNNVFTPYDGARCRNITRNDLFILVRLLLSVTRVSW